MKAELETALKEKYPLIFKYNPAIDCGDGWYTLLDVLCSALYHDYHHARSRYNNLVQWKKEFGTYPWKDGGEITDFMIDEAEDRMAKAELFVPAPTTVKEKFGSLRFYVDGCNEQHSHFISFAERMSMSVCEVCGAPGKTYTDGWLVTLCKEHAKEYKREEQ